MSLRDALLAGIRRRRVQGWLAVTGAALAVTAAVAVPALTFNGHSDITAQPSGTSRTAASTAPDTPSLNTPSPNATSPNTPRQYVTSTGSEDYPAISDEILATLADRGTEVTLKSGSDAAVSVDEAISAARNGGYPTLQPDQISASLAVVTTTEVGTDEHMDPTQPPDIKPLIDHQLVWIIAFNGILVQNVNPRQPGPPPTGLVPVDVVQFITSDSPAALLLGTTR